LKDKIPIKSNLRIKKEDKGYVIFNLETSGFHLVSQDGYEVLEACDGKKTIAELAKEFSEKRKEPLDDVRRQMEKFFTMLAKRRIIEWKNEK
jgi:hypothetical protein